MHYNYLTLFCLHILSILSLQIQAQYCASVSEPQICNISAMVMKVHGSPFSGSTMRVLAAAYEKDLDFELVFVDLKSGAHKQHSFLSLNPFGQIPALEDGDIKLFESRAITRYIAHRYQSKGSELLFMDGKQLGNLAVWMEVEAHQFEPVASKLVRELVYKKILFKMEADDTVVQENEAKLAKVLDVYEARLGQSKYLAGETFSLADLHHMATVHSLMGTRVKKLFDERPHVSAWCKDILARPSWQKVVALQKKP